MSDDHYADLAVESQQKLTDAMSRAEFLSQAAPVKPLTWHEFQQQQPTEEPDALRNAFLGSAVGMALGLIGGLLLPELLGAFVLAGTLFGGAAGVVIDNPTTRRAEQVEHYTEYLNKFEQALGNGHAQTVAFANPDASAEHASAILAARAQQAPGSWVEV